MSAQNNKNRDQLSEIVAKMDSFKGDFIGSVRDEVYSYLKNVSSKRCLTILEIRDKGSIRQHKPQVTSTYLQVLWHFCRKELHNGHLLDSALTEPVIAIVAKRYQAVFDQNIDSFSKSLSRVVMKDAVFVKALSDTLATAWSGTLPSQLRSQMVKAVTASMTNRLEEALHSNIGEAALHTIQAAATKGIATAVSTPIVTQMAIMMAHNLSVALGAQIKVIVTELLASGALKAIILSKIKVIVAATLLASLIHALAAKLTALGIAGGPGLAVAFIAIPILAAFLAWQYEHLPDKLADTIPKKIIGELDGNYSEMNMTIVEKIYSQIIESGLSSILNGVIADTGFKNAMDELARQALRVDH